MGTLAFGYVADRFGRRLIFTWSLIWYMVCTIIMTFQSSGLGLDIWRFIAGIGIGVELVSVDTYISELISSDQRGRAYAVNQFITFSVVPVVAFLAYALKGKQPFGLDYWRVVILIGSVGAIVVWILRRHIPENPRWLARHGQVYDAARIVADIERRVVAEKGVARLRLSPLRRKVNGPARSEKFLRRGIVVARSFSRSSTWRKSSGFTGSPPGCRRSRFIAVSTSRQASGMRSSSPSQILSARYSAHFSQIAWNARFRSLAVVIMAVVIAVFSKASEPWLLIALGVLFTLSSNIMSYAYHGYQAELYPTRVRARAIGFVYSWSRISAAFAGLAIGILLHGYGMPGVAVFIGISMLVAICMILLGSLTSGTGLETISH